jgi:hypothetical protein
VWAVHGAAEGSGSQGYIAQQAKCKTAQIRRIARWLNVKRNFARTILIGAAMKYRMLKKGEKVRVGDQYLDCCGVWCKSHNYPGRQSDLKYRRPISSESLKTGKLGKGRSTLNKRVMPLVSKARKLKTA